MNSGVGLAWRPETAWLIQGSTLGFTEVLAEQLNPQALPRSLLQLRDRGLPIIVHGVSLSLGGTERPESRRLDHLAQLAQELNSPFISEHVAFVRAGGLEAGHLLPVPRTQAMLQVLAENVLHAQRQLPVPLVLENVASLFEWPAPEFSEADFLAELLSLTQTRLLLDVSNLFANALNHGFAAEEYLTRLPFSRIQYAHIAGGVVREGHYHDTHAHPIGQGPLELLRTLRRLLPGLPVLLERDDRFGGRHELERELSEVASCLSTRQHVA